MGVRADEAAHPAGRRLDPTRRDLRLPVTDRAGVARQPATRASGSGQLHVAFSQRGNGPLQLLQQHRTAPNPASLSVG